jgi:hypothetical protein
VVKGDLDRYSPFVDVVSTAAHLFKDVLATTRPSPCEILTDLQD